MTTSNLLIKYPLDLTGQSPDNLVANEPHTAPREQARGFGLNYGAFYTKSLRITHTATGRPLASGVDFICLELVQRAFEASGQEVCAAVQIINDQLDGEFLVTYQAVGGEFSTNVEVINALLAALALDNRPVKWGDLIGLPTAFPPEDHYHTPDDLYGFEYLVEALERVRSAIMLGDYYDHDEIRQRIENLKTFLLNEDSKIIAMLQAHLDDEENPHATTKAQVGLGLVENFPTANQQEAEAGNLNNRFMTPLRVAQAISKLIGEAFNAHVNNKDNPHATTKAQVELGLVENYAVATQPEAEAGLSNSVYMTALRVAQAIKKAVGDTLTAHVNNRDNPHGTTAEQIGLGLVSNYATAQVVDVNNFATDKFMTPALSKVMIGNLVGDTLTAHINNHENPHGTTAKHVGLGFVQNYPVASSAEAQQGTRNDLYMTPALVNAAIQKIVGDGWVAKTSLARASSGWSGIYNYIPFVNGLGTLNIGRQIQFYLSGYNGPQASLEIRMPDSSPYAVGSGRGPEFFISGYLNCVDTYHRSDLRDKVDVAELDWARADSVLTSIRNGITYGLIDAYDKTAGLAAQVVQKYFPEAVVEILNDKGEPRLAIRDGALIGLLVSGYNHHDSVLQQQSEQLRILNDKVTELVEINSSLVKRIEDLERK